MVVAKNLGSKVRKIVVSRGEANISIDRGR